MAEKKLTTVKVAKKAPAKKATAKKAVAKKAVAKKAVAKKAPAKKAIAVKKAPTTKAVAVKKAPAKKAIAVKKAPTTKAPAKKAPTVKKAVATRATLSPESYVSLTSIPEVPSASQSSQPAVMPSSHTTPTKAVVAPIENEAREKKNSRGLIVITFALLLGVGLFFFIGSSSTASTSDSQPAALPSVSATVEPTVQPTVEPSQIEVDQSPELVATPEVVASYSYTSTGIRLAWNVNGIETKNIQISVSEDGGNFVTLATLSPDAGSLRIIKNDTKGFTNFRIKVTSLEGEEISTEIGLRGRFAL